MGELGKFNRDTTKSSKPSPPPPPFLGGVPRSLKRPWRCERREGVTLSGW